MAENSKIEWTHHTANLWWGCTKVHEGCDNCYAEALDNRWSGNHWGSDKPRRRIKNVFNDLRKYQERASKLGETHRVFVGSMMDIFEKPMPLENPNEIWKTTGDMREWFFAKISANCYPNLLFLFLTKRPSNINKYIPEKWKINPPRNVMFGTSPVNGKTYNILTYQLRQVNGNRFLSIEPQLENIKYMDLQGIDWVIQGGESGAHKRPFNIEWAYYMRDICKEMKVPYFFKQIDKIQPIPEDLMIREFPALNYWDNKIQN